MFALDGDVLQQALKEGETQDRQSATPTPAELRDSLHHSLGGMEKDGEVEGRLPKKEAEGVGNGIQGIIQDLPVGIRLHLVSDTESKTLPPIPLTGLPSERETRRKGIPESFRNSTLPVDSQLRHTASTIDDSAERQEPTPLESRRVVSEPAMAPIEGIPGLNPPPAFQERFKYIICSSGLLKERPDFEGKRHLHPDNTSAQLGIPEPRITLAGLGIQAVSYGRGDDENIVQEPETGGLRRRNIFRRQSGSQVEVTSPPASFRRPSSSSASAPSTPVFLSAKEYPSYTGWRFLAYTPFVRAISPYTEPIVLLLSSLLWMFQIVGWIWLEILAVGAIVLCGFTNIIVKMSTEEKRNRSRTRSRKSRRSSRDSASKRTISAPRTKQEQNSVKLDLTENIAANNLGMTSTSSPTEESVQETSRNAAGNDESAAIVLATQLEPPKTHDSGTPEPTSLQGLALGTLQTVVQNAEEMDEVIGNALTVIGESERSSRHAGNEARTKRLHQSLQTAFKNLNNHLTKTYNSLTPLVSSQELRTLEAMYGVSEDHERAGYQSPNPRSPGVPLPLRSPLMRLLDPDRSDKGMNRLSTSEYSTTSTSVEDDNSFERVDIQRTTGSPGRGGTIVKRNRARSSFTFQNTGATTPSRTNQPLQGFSGGGSTAVSQDRFSPLPARSPRLAQRSTSNLRRASSLKEKASNGTIRPSWTDASGESDLDGGEVRRLRYNWRYPTTLTEESESSQSLFATSASAQTEATIKSPLVQEDNASEHQHITIPVRPKGHLRELRLSQSGIGLNSQSHTPLLSSSLSPQFGLSRTPDEQDPGAYFQLGKLPGRASPMRLHRKRSSLQSLRYRNPDGTTVIASSPARHHRTRSSLDTTHGNLERFIGSLPPSMVSGLRGHGRREGDNLSDRSSRISDRNSTGVPRPVSSTGYASSPLLPTFHQPRLDRTVSFGHSTSASLKATLLAVHLKRKRVACALLALDFSVDDKVGDGPMNIRHIALAKYWADVHMILDDLRQGLSSVANDIQTTSASREAHYEPFLPGRPHDSFAPRQSDQFVMLEQIHILSRLLAGAQNELTELKSSVEQGDKEEILQQWDRLRLDLAAMIRTWEKGRTTASKTSLPLAAGAETGEADPVPDFVRHWDIDDLPVSDRQDKDTLNEQSKPPSVPDESSSTQVTAHDDATSHLLDSTSASFLPPPGIEDVFEAVLDFPPPRLPPTGADGKKLSREERIRMVKLARATATTGISKTDSSSSSGPLTAAAPTMAKNGQVMDELKSVIGEMKRRRATAPSAPECTSR